MDPWTLDRVAAQFPELAGLARLHASVEQALRDDERENGSAHPDLRGTPGVHWMQGTPLLDATDRGAVAARLPGLVRAAARGIAAAEPGAADAAEAVVESSSRIHWEGALLSFRDPAWTPQVREPRLFRFLLLRAISVPARHLARAFTAPHPDRWKRGSCPWCGVGAAASVARAGSGRTLLCVLCGGRWDTSETVCNGCGERNLGSFRVLASRDAGPATIESCGRCGTAVKVFSSADLAWGPPLAAEVATVRLDLLAERDEDTFRDPIALASVFPPG